MKWVVAAIAVFIAGYTFIELRFRKPTRPHEPAREMHDRDTLARLQKAGWVRAPIEVRRPVENPPSGRASVTHGALGLGLDLDNCFAEKPLLFKSIDRVSAPAAVNRGEDCVVYFTASVADLTHQLAGAELLQRGDELVIVPTAEHLPGKELYSRWNDSNYCVNLPTNNLAPGRYQLRLIANGPCVLCSVEVK